VNHLEKSIVIFAKIVSLLLQNYRFRAKNTCQQVFFDAFFYYIFVPSFLAVLYRLLCIKLESAYFEVNIYSI
jgi:hypothetical protein